MNPVTPPDYPPPKDGLTTETPEPFGSITAPPPPAPPAPPLVQRSGPPPKRPPAPEQPRTPWKKIKPGPPPPLKIQVSQIVRDGWPMLMLENGNVKDGRALVFGVGKARFLLAALAEYGPDAFAVRLAQWIEANKDKVGMKKGDPRIKRRHPGQNVRNLINRTIPGNQPWPGSKPKPEPEQPRDPQPDHEFPPDSKEEIQW